MAKAKVESLDEIVFANRNKDYGAYELRKRYNKIVTRALLVAIIITSVATIVPLIASKMAANQQQALEKNVLAELMNAKQDTEEPPPPPPPPKTEAPPVETVKYTAPVVVDSVDVNQKIATADEAIAATVNNELDTAQFTTVTQTEEIKQVVEEKVFEIVEEMPDFVGGPQALQVFLAENTHYPTVARENGVQGKVFVRFVVTSKGNVDQVSVVRGVDPSLDAEAIRVVRSLPKWKPGKQRGEAVNVWYTVPINFVLSN